MAANQVDFKILPSDQFSVYSPATRSDKIITYFTLLSKLRGDILSVGQDDDPNDIVSAFYSSVGGTQTLHLVKADGSEITASVPEPTVGTVTSVDLTASTGISVSGGPITTSGSITVTNTAPDQVVVLTGAGTTSISGTYPSFTITSNDQFVGTVTSVGLTMPAAFSVGGSPVTTSGTLAVTAIGLSSQYIRGDGQLANFPTPGGGGSSVNYYLNGSVSQGTFGGTTYYQMSKTPIAGAGTNFTRTSASGDGYVASFITDANDPDQINIPGGNFNLEFYFNSSSSGGAPAFYGELYKVSVSNVFTLIASGSVNPEVISGGTIVDQYYTSIAVPQTALLSTDRLAIRVYVIVDGRNITLHTEDNNFCEIITTFSTGLNSLNGLSDQVQYFAVGTAGTNFAISSSLDTHTFNLPTASATNRGALSSADWTTFNSKEPALTKGNLTEATSAVLTITGGTNAVIGTGTTIQVAQSGASTSGFLSSTDWNTFNGKQNAITLTTTGSTGAATLIGATLNIPNYADQFVGTVTSVAALTLGTTGTDLSSTVINGTTTPVITLQVPTASATNRGALSSADWTTFNSKQAAITLTTTGNTGAATFISNTLNIPNYVDQFVGTVTSVNLTAGTRIEVAGGPITTSGSITVTHGVAAGADFTTAQTFEARVLADGGIFEALGEVAIAIGSLEDAASPSSTDFNDGVVIQNVAIDEFGHLLGVGATDLDERYVQNLTAGTGITVSGSPSSTAGLITVTNSAPDQTVALTAGTGISISGTYPSFTITNTSAGGGTITGSGTTNYVPKWTSASAIGDSAIYDNAGNIGIGTTSPSYKLDVTGDVRVNTGALGVNVAPSATDGRIDASNDIVAFSSSDLRLKENIKPIENALEKVKSLTGVEFDWKPELKHAHGYEGHDTGVIAQEVQEVMPTAIRTNDTGYLAVRYEKLIGLLIEGMKEQQLQIDELKSKLK